MRKLLVLAIAISGIVFFTAAHKPSGPVIVASDIVTVPAGGSFGLTTLYTPQDNGIYNVYLFGNPCPGVGGAGVYATDPSGNTRLVSGPIIVGGGTPIQWNGAASATDACTLYVAIEQIL